KLVSDYILVSVHSHELAGKSKEQPAMFMEEFARHAIDMGADAVIGHGPHLLRPLEIYKGKPIFYSLGDFILQNENIPFMPEDYYESQGLTSDATMHDVFAKRSRNFTIGLQTKQVMFETVIPRWEIVDGKMTSLELLAVELGFGKGRAQGGVPAPAKDGSILERYAKMSEAYGTKMEISGNQARVVLS
ncbi:MAG: CapA family protein, partial [Lachnospiraceae bacterium]|nr:CapA family protein [Lachnospiraceae bacterium]